MGLVQSSGFNGSGVIATTGPIIDARKSFTVSAWVNLGSTVNTVVAVGQTAVLHSTYALTYDQPVNRWVFSRWADDSPSPRLCKAASTTVPALNTWIHLVGVFDAATGSMTIYVNGAAQGRVTDPTPINGTGALKIGQGTAGTPCCVWVGSISDVQIYDRALSATQIQAVYNSRLPGVT